MSYDETGFPDFSDDEIGCVDDKITWRSFVENSRLESVYENYDSDY